MINAIGRIFCSSRVAFGMTIGVLILAGIARGNDLGSLSATDPAQLSLSAPPRAPLFLDPMRWRFELLGVGLTDVTHRGVEMGGVRLAADYYTSENFCWRAELTQYGVARREGDTAAAQASLGLRHTLWEIGRDKILADVGFGIFDARARVPYNGTEFNFTFHTGVSLEHPLNDHTDLIVGIRYFHLSNARIDGPRHNPSLNGPEGYIGLLFE